MSEIIQIEDMTAPKLCEVLDVDLTKETNEKVKTRSSVSRKVRKNKLVLQPQSTVIRNVNTPTQEMTNLKPPVPVFFKPGTAPNKNRTSILV